MSEPDGHDLGRPIRVLWLAKGLGPGGMERLLVHHARLGNRVRFEYRAAYLVSRPDSVVPQLEQIGIDCVQLPSGPTPLSWVGELRRLVRAQKIDVVHIHSPHPAAFARPALRSMRSRPRLVYTEHSTWRCYGPAVRLANAVSYPLDDKHFAVSGDARSSVPGFLRGTVEVLGHGVDLEEIRAHASSRTASRNDLGVGSEEVVVTSIAHLRPIKGVDVLLEAAQRVLERHPEVVFLSVGHGPEREALERQHAELGLGDRFRFLGFRPDVHQLLAASDVFCLSSHQEGLPLAFMEASATGLPTVATRVGGLVEALADGEAGVLVTPGDPAELAAAVGVLVEDPDRRARMGESARIRSSEFDAALAIRRQEQVYTDLVRSRRRRGSGDR